MRYIWAVIFLGAIGCYFGYAGNIPAALLCIALVISSGAIAAGDELIALLKENAESYREWIRELQRSK